MARDYFKELYESKKELLRCYQRMFDIYEYLECFPKDEISKSIVDIQNDLLLMQEDICEVKQ